MRLVVEQQEMVIGTLHRVDPQVVAHLQVAAYLLACEAHYVELVLVFIELEHIAHADRACLYGGVELQRSIEGNVGMGNLQLQIEDEVVEGAASEVGVAAVDGVLECANLLAYILVYLGYLWFENLQHLLIDRTICHIGYFSLHTLVLQDVKFLAMQLVFVYGYRNLCICHTHGIVGRIEANHLLASYIGDGFGMACVVVTKEYQVESRNLACHLHRGVLVVFGCLDASFLTAMEESYHYIGLFVLLYVFHPLACARHHILETHAAP